MHIFQNNNQIFGSHRGSNRSVCPRGTAPNLQALCKKIHLWVSQPAPDVYQTILHLQCHALPFTTPCFSSTLLCSVCSLLWMLMIRVVFQKAGFAKTLSLFTPRRGKLWVFWIQNASELKLAVAMVTDYVNLTCSVAGSLLKNPSSSRSPPLPCTRSGWRTMACSFLCNPIDMEA